MRLSTENQNKSPDEPAHQVDKNIESILAFYKREEQKLGHPQRILEYASNFVGRPFFLGTILLFVALWILANTMAKKMNWPVFDPAPFFWLQGIITLCALLITTIVLIKQNRLAKFEEQRQHLELQVNLITEQKTTKLINLIEELRRDLPMVKDRDDPEAVAFQQPINPDQVLSALHEHGETDEEP